MAWSHTPTALTLLGSITIITGVMLLGMKAYCSQVEELRECGTIGLKYLIILPGGVLLSWGAHLNRMSEKALSDGGSMLGFHEIDSHCPGCYTQGVQKSSGLFKHKMKCPRCGREWRIPDL